MNKPAKSVRNNKEKIQDPRIPQSISLPKSFWTLLRNQAASNNQKISNYCEILLRKAL